jgi:hypothetical protein
LLGVVEVSSFDANRQLAAAGLATLGDSDDSCCYAVPGVVGVTGLGSQPWEVYVVQGRRRYSRRNR